jgi:hypothetical protein
MSFVYSPALIRVAGPDAGAFLDNLLTRNLADLAPGALAYAGLLTPQGKVAFDFFAWRDMDGAFLIEPAPARRDALRQRLGLYRLRAKVEIGDDARGLQGLIAFAPPPAAPDGVLSAPDPRQPGFGWRALGPATEIAALAAQLTPALSDADVRSRRIAAGAPDLAEDSGPEEFFALEALFEEFGAVDFHKGCFIGQENVSRMKRRATTRKKLCRIAYDSDAPVYGTTILAGEAAIGEVRSSAAGFAIAALRLDRALEAIDKGIALTVGGQAIRLAAPAWLILPAAGETGSGGG